MEQPCFRNIPSSVPQSELMARLRANGPPIPVIVNRQGGTASRLGRKLISEITAAFAESGLCAHVHAVRAAELADAVSSENAPVVVIGGGDGTLGTAANILRRTDQVLGILPLGTRNHLARELGLPLDIPGAARAIAEGAVRRIDLGCAGDRVFVNNCSVGIYSRLVRERERRHHLPKWLATLPAAWHVLRALDEQHFRLEWDGTEHRLKSPLLFIGNNRYSLEAGRLGQRDSMADGTLSLAAVEAVQPLQLTAMALRLIVGRADPERDFAALEDVAELTVYGTGLRDVALDGEVERMHFPLHVSILPKALSVIAAPPKARQPS